MLRIGEKILKLSKKTQFVIFAVVLTAITVGMFVMTSTAGSENTASINIWEDPENLGLVIIIAFAFPFALNAIFEMLYRFGKKVPLVGTWIKKARIRGAVNIHW